MKKNRRRLYVVIGVLITITQLVSVGIISAAVTNTGPIPVLKTPYLKDPNPAKMQQKIIPVQSWKDSYLIATLYQHDSMKWYYDIGTTTHGPINNISKPTGDVPVKTDIEAVIAIDSPLYEPDNVFEAADGSTHPVSRVPDKNREIGYVEAEPRRGDMLLNPPTVTRFVKNGRNFSTFMNIGEDIYGERSNFGSNNKSSMAYYQNLKILWEGTLVETKEIDVVDDAVMRIGETRQETATVKTQLFEGESWSYTDVTTRPKTTWVSSNPSVATVNPSGVVTAVSRGNTKITATWTDDFYTLLDSAEISVGEPITTPPPECTVPVPGQVITGKYLDPVVTAMIRADARGNEQFDVLLGIPTSERLYGNVFARNYLFQNEFVQMTGTCTFSVSVNKDYTLNWDPGQPSTNAQGQPITIPDPQSDTESKTYNYRIDRPYAFWKIKNLEVYKIDQASLVNYALPNSGIVIQPTGYVTPYYSASTNGNYYPPTPPDEVQAPGQSISGGTSRPSVPDDQSSLKSNAERVVEKVEVENDFLEFNGQTIIDNQRVKDSGPTPKQIPEPQSINENVLYSPNNLIEPTKLNKKDTPSSGVINYGLMAGNINGGADKRFAISGINTVTVHTPVVDYAVLPDSNRPFDQRMNPDMTRTVLVLDRPFTINFTETGQHLNIKGYGNRDYKKYTLLKRVIFPFDTYSEDKSQFYPKNTWVDIPVGVPSKTFQMPTWVDEGNYHVTTEAWAINSQGQAGCQQNYNGDLNKYCATEGFDVGVVGRLFGFRVWDIGDLRFENVFRTSKGSTNHTTSSYFSGGRDENAEPTNIYGNNSWILPVRSGSHPTEKATVPHNGYSFLFDFHTIGNLWNKGEGVRIDPTFWYVPLKGGTPIQVDLYYDTSGSQNKMIKVGSTTDVNTYSRMYQLTDKMRNINSTELQKAAEYEYNFILSAAQRNQITWEKFYKQYLTRKTMIGAGYEIEVLPYQSRTLIGPTAIPTGVNPTEALRSVQHWYGEYNIPIAPYILPKNTDIVALANKYGGKLDGHEIEFLKDGYVMVNFGIYTVKNNDQNTRVLGYKAPIANMWAIEGQVTSSQDYLGNQFIYRSGDIMMFESNYSVRNDFQAQSK